MNWCAFYGRQCQDPQRGGDGGTHLGAAPDGLEDDEVRDLAEPGDVLRAREDAGAEHRDPRKARAAVAIPRHAHTLSTVLGFLSALAPPQRDWLPQLLKRRLDQIWRASPRFSLWRRRTVKRGESDGSDILVGRNPTVDIIFYWVCLLSVQVPAMQALLIGCLAEPYTEFYSQFVGVVFGI